MYTPRAFTMCIIGVLFLGITATYAWANETTAPLYQIVSEIQSHPKESGPVRRSASVEVTPELFELSKQDRETRLRFPGFDGDMLGVVSWERIDGAKSFSIAGELVDDATGYFMITVHGDAATVALHHDAPEWLRVKPSAAGYILQEIDLSEKPECGACQAPRQFRMGMPTAKLPAPVTAKDEQTQIDVLVVYTEAARNQAGSVAGIEAQIINSADQANLSYANSDIPLTISVVHMAEVDYQEDYALALALAKLTFPNDGVMDEVHDLRNEYNADMVSLIASGGDVAGIGWILQSLDGAIAHQAFSITVYYALGSLTFAHELGHNMGCDHDQQNITADGFRLFSYSRGWRFNAASDGILRRTVMSYAPGARIPYFSNPDITFGDTPTGVAIGHPDEAHNAQTITISAPYLAANRPLTGEGELEGEDEYIYDGYYCQMLGDLYHNETLRSLLPPFAIALFDLLDPDVADLNGGADPETLTFLGNGMLDCAYELGLLREVLDTPTLDLSSDNGLSYALVSQAYTNNYAQVVADIGIPNATLVNMIAPGLLNLAAAYITIGDDGSVGFIDALMEIVNEAQYIGELNLPAYTRLPEYLSADGDADGDGATNREEYQAYAAYGAPVYIAFALNPAVYPTSGGPGSVTIVGRPRVMAGTSTLLTAVLSQMVGTTTIAWYKDGEALPDANAPAYHIPEVSLADAGAYIVIVTDESKSLYESAPFILEVLPEGSMPATGVLALIAVALLLSVTGVWRYRMAALRG